jgi:hypothetical protein
MVKRLNKRKEEGRNMSEKEVVSTSRCSIESVLVISPHFPPLGSPQALQTYRKVKAFCEYGFQVTVLAADPGGVKGNNLHLNSQLPLDIPGLTVHRFRIGHRLFKKSSFLSKAYRLVRPYDTEIYFSELRRSLARLLMEHPYDIIISVAEPLVSHAALQSVQSLVGGAKQVYWFGDPVPMVANVDMMKLAWRRKQCERIARRCVEYGDLVIGVTDEILEPMKAMATQKSPIFAVVPHCFDESDWPWPPRERQKSTSDVVTVLHSGALYYVRTPFVLLKGVALALQKPRELPPIRVKLQGTIAPYIARELESYSSQVPLVIEGPREFADSKQAMVEADILCVIDCQLPRNVHLPSKLADYIGACRPILYIGRPDSPTCRLLDGVHPAFAQANSPQEVVTALKYLVSVDHNISLSDYRRVYDKFLSTRIHSWIFNLSDLNRQSKYSGGDSYDGR